MGSKDDISRAARALVDRLGDEAPFYAALRARDWRDAGENEASAVWQEVVEATRTLLSGEGSGREESGREESGRGGTRQPARSLGDRSDIPYGAEAGRGR